MYKLKKGTIKDVEEIWQIIGKTWLDHRPNEADRAPVRYGLIQGFEMIKNI